MKIKSRPLMTLLETLVAMSLLVMLIGLVFGFFSELNKINSAIEKEQNQSFRERYVEMRLAQLFSNLVNEAAIENKESFYFYSSKAEGFPSLVFTYNNGVRLDPSFAGTVLGRLYVDSKKQLCLATWPLFSKELSPLMHKEVLLENVDKIYFKFFASSDVGKNETSKAVAPSPGWQDEWLLDYHEPPAIVKIFVYLKEGADIKEKLFAFPLTVIKHPIKHPESI